MPSGTYKRGVSSHSNFSPSRFKDFDGMGKQNATEFLELDGWTVEENDKDGNGKTIFTNTDLVARRLEEILFFEAEVKRDQHWKYIFEGVDIPDRKAKYFKPGIPAALMMCNKSNTNMLRVPGELIYLACQDCPDMWFGDFGAKSSPNFIMPDHGCHRVMKYCRDEYNGRTLETFVRIPYKYVQHHVREGDTWTLQKEAEPLI